MPTIELPPVTEAHRRAAFASLAMPGWTFDAALRDPLRAQVIECRAAQLRTREWQAANDRETVCVRRLNPITGQWHTQRVAGDYTRQQSCLDDTRATND